VGGGEEWPTGRGARERLKPTVRNRLQRGFIHSDETRRGGRGAKTVCLGEGGTNKGTEASGKEGLLLTRTAKPAAFIVNRRKGGEKLSFRTRVPARVKLWITQGPRKDFSGKKIEHDSLSKGFRIFKGKSRRKRQGTKEMGTNIPPIQEEEENGRRHRNF